MLQIKDGEALLTNPKQDTQLKIDNQGGVLWQSNQETFAFSADQLLFALKQARLERKRCKHEIKKQDLFGCADEAARWITLFYHNQRIKIVWYETKQLVEFLEKLTLDTEIKK